MMKRFFGMMGLLAVMMLMVACGGEKEHQFVGKFTDEFGNKFDLREDRTATIVFSGMADKPIETTWSNGEGNTLPYATIMFNGDPSYWYMRDGFLYRHRKDMELGRFAINITWDE